MSICLRRRDFVAGLGGAAALPLAARAQQDGSVRRIGVLLGFDENDPLAKTSVSAFTQALAGLGWTDGGNVRIVPRWGGASVASTYARRSRRDMLNLSLSGHDPKRR